MVDLLRCPRCQCTSILMSIEDAILVEISQLGEIEPEVHDSTVMLSFDHKGIYESRKCLDCDLQFYIQSKEET